MRFSIVSLVVTAGVSVSGCASTSPSASHAAVDTMVRERVGASPGLAVPGSVATRAMPPVLEGIVDAERAVEIALTRSPSLRARIEELGLADADLIQAGLISNPRAHASFRFPAGGGAEGTGSEAGIDLDFLDVLTRPLKKRVAAGQLEQAKLKLGHEILKTAVDVKAAFYGLQATLQRLELRRTIVESMKTSVELAQGQLDAGNISELDLANHKAAYHDAAIELRHDEAEASVEREKLALLMGAQDQGNWKVSPQMVRAPASDPDRKRLEAIALAQRWDLSAARREPAILEDALRLARLSVFEGLEVGVDSERDFDGARGVGPDAEVPVPIFDRGQAAKAKVRAQLRQSRLSLTALEQQVLFEVRSAWTYLTAARKNADDYEANVLPLRKTLVEETLKRYNFMLEGVYQLLETKRSELDAQRRYIDAQKAYWTAWAELERAVGGRIPSELVPAKRDHHGGHE